MSTRKFGGEHTHKDIRAECTHSALSRSKLFVTQGRDEHGLGKLSDDSHNRAVFAGKLHQLCRAVATGTSIVREAVLDILIDLTGSFGAEFGFDNARLPCGSEILLDVGVRQAVAALRSEIEICHASEPIDARARDLAAELIQLLDKPLPDQRSVGG